MSKNLKSFITRMIVFIILMVGVVTTANLYQASVAPTVTDTVALGQMNDTDEGHITMRAYTHSTNNLIPTAIILVPGFILYFVVVSGSLKSLIRESSDLEPETKSQK